MAPPLARSLRKKPHAPPRGVLYGWRRRMNLLRHSPRRMATRGKEQPVPNYQLQEKARCPVCGGRDFRGPEIPRHGDRFECLDCHLMRRVDPSYLRGEDRL